MHIVLLILGLVGTQCFLQPRILVSRKLFGSQRSYPFSQKYYENYLHRLNSKNITLQNHEILGK
jgi:hypothetical protein